MKLLLIGGTGVLSSAVSKSAVDLGISVTSITRGNRKQQAEVESIECDCRDYEKLHSILNGRYFDVVVDFLSFDAQGVDKAYRFFSSFADQYIFVSSAFVYNFHKGGVFDEHSPLRLQEWQYSINKADAEDALRAIAEDKCKITIVRPMVTYGDTRIPYGLAPRHGYDWTLVARLKAGKPIITWNGGLNRCTIMRTEEFAVGLLGLLGNENAYGQTFNICGDESPTWLNVLEAVARYVKCELKTVDVHVDYIAANYPAKRQEIYGRAVDAVVSNAKIKKVVPEFKQEICLVEGVSKTLTSYEVDGFKMGIDWEYDGFCDKILKGQGVCAFETRFVDYLGDATIADRYKYWRSKNFGAIKQKIVSKLIGFSSTVLRKAERLIRKDSGL